MAQPDSVKLLLWFLALSSASLSWILPAVKVFFKNVQWDLLTTGLASILGLYLLLMFCLVHRSEFKSYWLSLVVLPTTALIAHRFINLPSSLSTVSFFGRLWFSAFVISFAMMPIRPASAWFSRFFLTVRWIFYIIMLVPIAVGCYHNRENWPWLSTGATCVFAELLMIVHSVDGSETKDKSKKSTNYFEIIPFVLTLSVLLLFICIPRITMAPTNSTPAPEWTFDEFYDQLEANELTDRQIYKNATRIRAGLTADNNRRKPDYSRAPLLFWFYDDIISIPPLTKLLRATYPKTAQATNKLYYSFFDDTMLNNELFNFHGDQTKTVNIMQQSIDIADLSNDTGSVEIYEKYVAKGWNEEVAYQFALPENCVVTGVWLQEITREAKPNKEQGHKYLVSPRGAAQRVYNKLKERRVDPALLEQVGPMQYRLKVYPIPTHTTAMHMWLRYEFIKTESGDIPLPKLLRVDGADLQSLNETTIIFNNTKIKVASKNEVDSWMPEIPVKMPLPTDAQSCTMMINQQRVVVKKSNKKLFDPEATTVAVVVDSSYSMRVHENAVLEAVSKLEQNFGAVDVFSARRRVTQCSDKECLSDPTSFTKLSLPLNKKDIIFLGSTNHDELVISKAHLNATYDVTILLTDEGTINPYYKRSEQRQSLSRGDFWMVHLNGKYPTKFQDYVTETMFINDAKVALSIEDVIDRYSPGRDSMHETDMKPCHESLLKFAAKQYMQKYLRERMIDVDEDGEAINPLEKVHEMAIKNTIVTPYSSMIVLINRAQKDMLEIEEDKSNKFERQNEADERYSSWQWNSLFSSAPSQLSSAVPVLIFVLFLSLSTLLF